MSSTDNIGLPTILTWPAATASPPALRWRNPRGAQGKASSDRRLSEDDSSRVSAQFPNLKLFAQPADIVSQILNFGLPAPIDIQVTGPIGEMDHNHQVAEQIAKELAAFRVQWMFTSSKSPKPRA